MGRAKLVEVVVQRSNNIFLRQHTSSLYPFFPNRLFNLHSYNAHHERSDVFSQIKLPAVVPKVFFVMNACYFSTASQLFGEMPRREQNSLFYYALDILKSCTLRPDSLRALIPVHCLALKIGAVAHLPTSTSLLIAYSRVGDFSSSCAIFDEIFDRDVILWNAVITASVDNSYFRSGLKFFVEMMELGSRFDSTTLLMVISAISQMKDLTHGRVVHGVSIKAGMLTDNFLCNALTDMYAKCYDLSSSECMFAEMECRDTISWNSMLTGYHCNDNPENSLWYFKEMACCGVTADHVSFSCAISACAYLADLDSGQGIHGLTFKLGYGDGSCISVSNSLISLYLGCGQFDMAVAIFRGMTCRDVVSWNAIIDGFASQGKSLEAFYYLREMQLTGSFQPHSVSVVAIIAMCAELMLLREGRTVHGFTIRREMGSGMLVTNSLLDMYSKCNDIKRAELLFKAKPERDLISWNTMISGYSQNGKSRKAQNLFKELLCVSSVCSLSTLLAILPSCNDSEALEFGKSIHCWQLKLGLLNNILAVNSLMFMYINCGDLPASFLLLQRMSIVPDIACWNTLIAGCTQNGHFGKAIETFNSMRQETVVRHDSITLVSVISACGNLGLVMEGRYLHGLALKTLMVSDIRVQNALITMYGRHGETETASSVFCFSTDRNLCSWNCMISALSQNRDGKRALELFRSLEFELNEITIVCILSACTQLGVLRHGKEIHGCVFRLNYQGNSFITASLVDMYSNCGRLDTAVQIFQNAPEKSVASWNSMISAYGFHSNGKKAIQLFHEMCESETRPTSSTFISLLSACSHSGLVNEGLLYYDHMMDEFGVDPLTEHHVCKVDMLGRSGRLGEAYEFIKQMPTQPEPGILGALLSACNYHGDLEMGREVAELLFQLEPENVGYYISLSNMYVAAGRWNNAVELRRIVQDKQLKKPAGYSLVEVGLGPFSNLCTCDGLPSKHVGGRVLKLSRYATVMADSYLYVTVTGPILSENWIHIESTEMPL